METKSKAEEKEIEAFIREFSKFGTDVRRAFTEGCCYWFAYILKGRFPESARIIYLPEASHFVTKIGEKFYDITGNVTKKYARNKKEDWEEFQKYEQKKAEKIGKECLCRF